MWPISGASRAGWGLMTYLLKHLFHRSEAQMGLGRSNTASGCHVLGLEPMSHDLVRDIWFLGSGKV